MTAWLDRYQSIPVTPYNYEDKDVYSPRWTIHYVEKNVGEETSAREILMYYSDEPDWGMDSANVSPFQLLMGDGHGFRHQRYIFGPFQIGDAPNRAIHFYSLSKKAFAKGDPYRNVSTTLRQPSCEFIV